MGNRAVIEFMDGNGGRDSVEGFCEAAAKLVGRRSFGEVAAMSKQDNQALKALNKRALCAVITGLTGKCEYMTKSPTDCDDNGVYIESLETLRIIHRRYPSYCHGRFAEQSHWPVDEFSNACLGGLGGVYTI